MGGDAVGLGHLDLHVGLAVAGGQLGVIHKDGGQFGAHGGAVGVQQVPRLAADDARAHGHAHAVCGPIGHIGHVGIGAQVAVRHDLALQLGVTGKDGGDLSAGDGALAIEAAVSGNNGQSHFLRPGGGGRIPLALHIGKGGLAHLGLALRVVQRLEHRGAGHHAVGGEHLGLGAGGAHDAVLDDIMHRLGVPRIGIHIRPVGGLGLLRSLGGRAGHFDPPLSDGVGIVLAHHTAQLIHDVVDQHLVVDHHTVLQQRVVLEHHESVAAGLQHIVMGRQRVGLLRVNGRAVYQHILYPALTLHLHELLLVVQHHAGGDAGIDCVGEPGHLQEPSVLLRRHPRAHLQRVQDVLARGLHHARLVSEGMHVDDLLIGDVSGGNVRAYAAAVDKRHVRVQHHTVCVGAQVAQIGLRAPHRALPRNRVLGGQLHVGLGHHFFQHFRKFVVDALHKSRRGLILRRAVLRRHQLAGDFARRGVDDYLAQVLQLRAGLGHHHVLTVLVLLRLFKGAVGMAVDQHVDAGGVCDHLRRGPWGALLIDAQVPQRHHIVRALGPRRVHGLLHRVIQVRALVPLAEAVDIVSLCILEVGRRRLCEGLRRIDAHIAHLHIPIGQHLVPFQYRVPLQVRKIGAQVLVLRLLLCQAQEVFHPVVELMVSRDGQIVAHLVHDVHDVCALGQRPDGAALDRIAGVHQRYVSGAVLGLHRRLIRGHTRVSHVGDFPFFVLRLIDPAVHIVCVQDHDLSAFALFRSQRWRRHRDHHGKRQEQREHLLFH